MFTRRLSQVVIAAVVAAMPGLVQAQDVFDRAKTLYLEAAYEDALALLEAPGPSGTADVHLYRALCLLALGRSNEADAAIARSIELDPMATAARQDVSPRVAALLADARRRMLPDIARRRVADGRMLYQQGDRAGATQRFEAAVRVLDDPTLVNQGELADLRTLASGFLDLMRAQAAPTPAAAPAATPALASVTATTAAANPGPPPAAPAAATEEGAAVPAAAAVTRPKVLSQIMPPWRPPDSSWRGRELRGMMLLTIDATGRVTGAQMEQTIYPGYDRLLLDAARTWRYTPATRDGQPTESQLIVPIVVKPPGQ
jgi:TonB family protein